MRSRAPRSPCGGVSDGPGPGAYARTTDFTQKRAASRSHQPKGFGGTTASRFGPPDSSATRSPGPGSYGRPVVPPMRRGGRPRSAAAAAASAGSFNKGHAHTTARDWAQGADSPGPGAYGGSSDYTAKRRASRSSTAKGFGGTTASRFGSPASNNDGGDGPGPGAYGRAHCPPRRRAAARGAGAPQQTTGGTFGTGDGHTLGRAWTGDSDSPGPGAYVSQQQASAFRVRGPTGAPGKGFGGSTEDRFNTAQDKERQKLPGPGAYNAARSKDMMYRIPG